MHQLFQIRSQDELDKIKNTSRYHAIDGLRGLAVIGISILHIAAKVRLNSEINVSFFARGVQMFFILSGLVLSASWKLDVSSKDKTQIFYLKRALRILPLWFIGVSTAWFAYKSYWLKSLLSYIFLFGFDLSSDNELVLGSWSLFVEILFYLAFPYLVQRLNSIFKTLVTFILFCSVSHFWLEIAIFLKIPDYENVIFRFPVNHIMCFLGGMLIFQTYDRYQTNLINFAKRFSIIFDLLFFGCLILSSWIFHNLNNNFVLVNLAFMIAVLVSVSTKGVTSRILNFQILQFIGLRCYSIYIFQFLVLDCLDPWKGQSLSSIYSGRYYSEIWFLIWFFLYWAMALPIAEVLYYFIEQPFVRLGQKINQTPKFLE